MLWDALGGQLRQGTMLLRELLALGRAPREPGPSQLLGPEGIRAAMDDGGAVDGRTAAGYLYHSARISCVIAGCATCVDLGCGTGVQLLQVAQLNPQVRFTGVDHQPTLLERAAARARALGLDNVEWCRDDIVAPRALGAQAFDAAISTMTLHDLPSVEAVTGCLEVMRRLTGDRGAVYVEDFGRLRSPRSMDYFAGLNAPPQPDAFSALYRASLGSAFTREELQAAAAAALPHARCHATFAVPFLVVIKTPDRELPGPVAADLRRLRDALGPAQRRDLDELQRFFRLGGLRGDPFA